MACVCSVSKWLVVLVVVFMLINERGSRITIRFSLDGCFVERVDIVFGFFDAGDRALIALLGPLHVGVELHTALVNGLMGYWVI